MPANSAAAMTAKTPMKARFPYEYLIVASLCLINFGPVALVMNCAGLFFTPVAADISTTPATMSYFLTMVSLPMVFLLSVFGKLFNRIDCRIIVSGSICIVICGFVLLSFIQAVWQYLALCAFMGIGLTSLIYLAPPVLVNRWFSKRAGFYVGLVMAFTGVGGVIWATVGGILIASIGWRLTYLVFAGISALLGLPGALLILRNRPSDLGRVPYGFEQHLDNDAEKEECDGAIATSSTESYENQGVLAKDAYRMPTFVFLLAFGFVFSLCPYVYGMIPSYVATLPVSADWPLIGALASSCAMFASIFAKMLWGGLAEKNVLATVVAIGVIAIIGVATLCFFPMSAVLIFGAAIAYGMYYGEHTVVTPIATRMLFGMKNYSEIYSKISTVLCIGIMVGTLVGGTIVNVTGSYQVMFVYIICALAVSMVLFAVAWSKRPR